MQTNIDEPRPTQAPTPTTNDQTDTPAEASDGPLNRASFAYKVAN